MQVCTYSSMQLCKYANMQVCTYIQVCKYVHMQVCTYMQVCLYTNKCEAIYVSAIAAFLLIDLSKTYEAALSNCIYLTQFSTDFGKILDSKSYDQA